MHKRTKIVCTIGPASESVAALEAMLKAGMNVARLNFSHGEYKHHALLIRHLREASKNTGIPVSLMQDLQGPRIRTGVISGAGIKIEPGQTVVLAPEDTWQKVKAPTGGVVVPIQFPQLVKFVHRGGRIFINDGLFELEITKTQKLTKLVYCRVVAGGVVTSHRGMNVPGANIRVDVLTAKDRADLKFGLEQGVDWVALSFVQAAKDVEELRTLITKLSPKRSVGIIAKIERQQAVDHFSAILKAADGIMVARGDLGIELPPEQIPILQKDMVSACVAAAKPVIVATQMLESMIKNRRPTRAEVSDVANAVIDHTDAVMLSGESASGDYPVEAVSVMARTIAHTEQSPYDDLLMPVAASTHPAPSVGVARSISALVRHTKAQAVIVFSSTGTAARLVARFRPETNIIAVTPSFAVARRLLLSWGVIPQVLPIRGDLSKLTKAILTQCRQRQLLTPGRQVIIVTEFPRLGGENSNLLKAVVVPES